MGKTIFDESHAMRFVAEHQMVAMLIDEQWIAGASLPEKYIGWAIIPVNGKAEKQWYGKDGAAYSSPESEQLCIDYVCSVYSERNFVASRTLD